MKMNQKELMEIAGMDNSAEEISLIGAQTEGEVKAAQKGNKEKKRFPWKTVGKYTAVAAGGAAVAVGVTALMNSRAEKKNNVSSEFKELD